MAIGDDATAAGYQTVPDTGEEGRVRWGAREINRTRDYIALLKALIPTNKAGFRSASGITSGEASASGGNDGDVYFKVIIPPPE